MPRGRPRRIPSIAELQQMIREQRAHRTGIIRERRDLQKRLDQIDRELAMLDGSRRGGRGGRGRGMGRGRRRARNEMSLPEAMEAVLKKAGKPMRVGDIVDAVRRVGYRSTSANFRGIVNQTLIKDQRFKSSSRGMYQLK